MGAIGRIGSETAMVSRWRRRRMCVLIDERPAPAGLRDVSSTGAFLETVVRPELGRSVELHHPEAGAIEGVVESHEQSGIRLSFPCTDRSMAFAVAAIVSDMTA